MTSQPIDPQIILKAFSAAEILVSMSDGPARERDTSGEPYFALWGNDGMDRYLDDLVSHAGEADHVLIEWRVWPEILANGRIYSRLTVRNTPEIKIQ